MILGTRAVCLLGTAILVSACAMRTPGARIEDESRAALAAAKTVAHFRDLSFAPISSEPFHFRLTSDSQALRNGGDPVFAHGLALPPFGGPYGLQIRSHVIGTKSDPALLYPDVQFLNERYEIVRRIDPTEWRLQISRDGEFLQSIVFINNADRGERFVVVTSLRPDTVEAKLSNQSEVNMTPISVSVPGGVATWLVPTGGNSTTAKLRAVPVGKITVHYQPYRPRRMGEQQ